MKGIHYVLLLLLIFRKTALQNCLTIRNIRCCYRVDLQNCLETQTMATDTVKIYWFNLLLTGASSFMSLFGGFVIVLSYVRLRQIRNFTRTLLLYLTIADLMTATGNLVATIRYGIVHSSHSVEDNWVQNCSEQASKAVYRPVCVGQSFVTTFSNMASFFWTAIIALHIWISVTFRSKKAEMTCAHIFFHVISWCVPCEYYFAFEMCQYSPFLAAAAYLVLKRLSGHCRLRADCSKRAVYSSSTLSAVLKLLKKSNRENRNVWGYFAL